MTSHNTQFLKVYVLNVQNPKTIGEIVDIEPEVKAIPVNPEDDGVTHYNTGRSGTTHLGNFASLWDEAVFFHPEFGQFRNLESARNWLRFGKCDDRFRVTGSSEAVTLARGISGIYNPDLVNEMRQLMVSKVMYSARLRRAMEQSNPSIPCMTYNCPRNDGNIVVHQSQLGYNTTMDTIRMAVIHGLPLEELLERYKAEKPVISRFRSPKN